MTTFSIQSFGCRVNQAEAFTWTDSLQANGLVFREDTLSSDVVLVNTCTLTGRADRDVRAFIRKVGRENPGAKIFLTGCGVDRLGEGLQLNEQVVNLFPNAKKKDLVEAVLAVTGIGPVRSRVPYKSRMLVKIQDGCDYRCRFCVIPSVRGPSVSIDRDRIFARIENAIERGFYEIVLTGVHVGLYGRDLTPPGTFLDLLRDIAALPGLGRIRLSSLDPRFLEEDLLLYILSEKKICPHFHLSLQSGSDSILQAMGRNIEVNRYRAILNVMRELSFGAALGADILVGFPGETDELFEETLFFLETSPLTSFHLFSYSPRPGTPAASMPNVTERIVKERMQRLRRLSAARHLSFRRDQFGRILEAVVIRKGPRTSLCLTGNYVE
ncbi:MAG: MiaB/RimO family radical SAM methylthiotransferase, partial [Candidatus Aminicenantes bacterium]|nr:MiaB/RimO family radical SAM methylthiotransferase [Candidatus Aminicenantes bacterium]